MFELPRPRPPPASADGRARASPSPSPFLTAMRAMNHKPKHADNHVSPPPTLQSRRPPFGDTMDRAAESGRDELSWTGSRVLWRRDGAVFRSFTFKEHVRLALFADFHVDEPHRAASKASQHQATSAHDLSANGFAPVKRQQPTAWTDEPLAVPLRPTPPTKIELASPQRCVVVILSDVAIVYPPQSEPRTCYLGTKVSRAWPLSLGVMLETTTSPGPSGQTLLYLADPVETPRAVKAASPSVYSTQGLDQSGHQLHAQANAASPLRHVIFASALGVGEHNVIVTSDDTRGRLCFWSGQMADDAFDTQSAPGPPSEKQSRSVARKTYEDTNEHGKRMRPQAVRRPSLPRAIVDMQQSVSRAPATSQRGHRRQSIHAGTLLHSRLGQDASQVFDALEEELASAHPATAAGRNSHLQPDRRTSFSRVDLSVTMDRMALGSTSRQSQSKFAEMSSLQDPTESSTRATLACKPLLELNLPTPDLNHVVLFNVLPDQATIALHSSFRALAQLVRIHSDERGQISAHDAGVISAKNIWAANIRHRDVQDLVISNAEDKLSYLDTQGKSRALHSFDRSRLLQESELDQFALALSATARPFSDLELKLLAAVAANMDYELFGAFERTMVNMTGYGHLSGSNDSRSSRFAVAFEAFFFETGAQSPERPPQSSSTDLLAQLLLPLAHRTHSCDCRLRDCIDTSTAQATLRALHLVAEETRLCGDAAGAVRLYELCQQLASSLSMPIWMAFYSRVTGVVARDTSNRSSTSAASLPASTPPSLERMLRDALLGLDAGSLSTAAHSKPGTPLLHSFYAHVEPLERYDQLRRVIGNLTLSKRSLSTRAQAAVLEMHVLGWTLQTIERLPIGLRVMCHEAMRVCQGDAPTGWPKAAYELIGRTDLAAQVDKTHPFKPKVQEFPADPTSKLLNDSKKEQTASVPRVSRFNEDKRVEEVERMLQTAEPVTIGGDRTLDQLTPNVQQSMLFALSNRTVALPVGRGLFAFCTGANRPRTYMANIPPINTSARLLPMTSPSTLQEKEGRDGQSRSSRLTWPEFHNGVAFALEWPEGAELRSLPTWTPEDLSPRFAGMLLGLGLRRQLHVLGFNQAFELLKVKHDPTSVAILVGLATTYIGTSDPKVTSLISVHLAALHPPQSSPLSVSGTIQAAGLVGIGLLNFASKRRSLADIMLREIESVKVIKVDDPPACREAYALSAGLACGMIMLGSGRQANTISAEMQLLQTLRQLILGNAGALSSRSNPTTAQVDVSITAAPATVALAMMYLKSGRQDVAEILRAPDSAHELDLVRPDALLLRTLARFLVLWDVVNPSRQWVDSCLPAFIREASENGNDKSVSSDLEVARWNMLSGACLAIGFKFAGSAAAEAHSTLIHYLDRLARASYVKAGNVQARLRRQSVRACLNVVSVALAMVMAGTGELNVLRRLRVAHGHFGEGVGFGVHMASHMALGLLLLGKGRYTLGTSDKAVASLLASVYPVFPSSPSDNRTHLQALRHLWTIGVEARCLEARDVDTSEPVFLPVRLRLAEAGSDDVRTKQLVAPTLVPDLRLIQSLQVDTPRYWPYVIDFVRDGPTAGTLWVKRKSGHLTYAQDPRGIRSIFTRSKGETGNAVIDFGETARKLSPSVAGLRDFVSSFVGNAETHAAVNELCWDERLSALLKEQGGSTGDDGPSNFEAFCACVLLECLTRDKQSTIAVYLEIYHAWHTIMQSPNEPTAILALEDVVSVLDFYAPDGPFQKTFAKSSKSTQAPVPRDPLLQHAFLNYLRRRCASETRQLVQDDAQATATLAALLRDPQRVNTSIRGPVALYLGANMSAGLSSLERLQVLARDCLRSSPVGTLDVHQRAAIIRAMLAGVKKQLMVSSLPTWTSLFEEDAATIWSE
ncbi:hypothetical protein ACM66B_006973 [Microbotryomycetes sp. NB124-2]